MTERLARLCFDHQNNPAETEQVLNGLNSTLAQRGLDKITDDVFNKELGRRERKTAPGPQKRLDTGTLGT